MVLNKYHKISVEIIITFTKNTESNTTLNGEPTNFRSLTRHLNQLSYTTPNGSHTLCFKMADYSVPSKTWASANLPKSVWKSANFD